MPNPKRSGARVAHIGIAVASVDALLPFYRDVLGMDVVPLDDADGARIAGLAAGDSLVELLEPGKADSPIGKFIAKRGPGIRLIDDKPRVGAEGKQIAFLHPSSTGGVLIELTEP